MIFASQSVAEPKSEPEPESGKSNLNIKIIFLEEFA